MGRRLLGLAAIVPFLASGCTFITGMPMTADAFREKVRGGATFTEVKEFDADQSYGKVVNAVTRKADECFRVAVETTSRSNMSYSRYKNTYTPTVIQTGTRTELHLQQKTTGNVISPREPEAGHYILVVDIVEKGRSRVGVSMYVPTMGYDHVVKAVEGWIQGTSTMCPDLI